MSSAPLKNIYATFFYCDIFCNFIPPENLEPIQ